MSQRPEGLVVVSDRRVWFWKSWTRTPEAGLPEAVSRTWVESFGVMETERVVVGRRYSRSWAIVEEWRGTCCWEEHA